MTPRQIKLRFGGAVLLALAPLVFLAGVGMYHLWDRGWSFVSYWPMALSFLASYLLAWLTIRRLRRDRAGADLVDRPNYWTERDQRAWKLVEQYAASAPGLTPDQMGDLARYAGQAQDLALQIAKVYQPAAAEPFGHLTLPEVLACGELVTQDVNRMVVEYIPGSHLLSLGDLKRLRSTIDRATDWYPRLRNAYWLVSAIVNPIRTGLQVAMTKGAMGPAQKGLQANAILWFQMTYLRHLGRYLIELNSGRLKVGARRYRELLEQHRIPAADPSGAPGEEQVAAAVAATTAAPSPPPAAVPIVPVTVALVGPVKAGKSSLVNAFLGEQRAATDILPLTAGQVRYTLARPGLPPLTLVDTEGFGHEGPSADDVRVAVDAAGHADILLVVTPARSAARKPEVEFLERIRSGLAARPDLKMPPVVAVLTHVDLLSPAMEWAPPYDWQAGKQPKEASIRDALTAAKEQFGDGLAAAVPVCTVPGKEAGVRDDLMAALAAQLGEARGVSLLRALHAEAGAEQAGRVFQQLYQVGGHAARLLWDLARK